MASSNNSKTEKKKSKNGETLKIGSKSRKERDSEKKEKENKNKKKKLKLSNGNLKDYGKVSIVPCSSTESKKQKQKQKQREQNEEEDNNTVVTNGRTSVTKPKKPKRKKEEHEEQEDGDAKTHAFPMNRIRTMIKGEDPDLRVSQEAILAINKAAEKFLEQFTQDAYACCVQERRKSLGYKHLAYVVTKQRKYDFLSDFVPEKVKAEDALRQRNSGGT